MDNNERCLRIAPGTVLDMAPGPGSDIDRCKTEAILLAKRLSGNVRFKHNGLVFMADTTGSVIEITQPDFYR